MIGNPVYATSQVICRVGTTLMFDLKVTGTRNVPRAGGVLVVANHQSYLDPVVIGAKLHRPVSFFAKSELFENRHFGWLIRKFYAFPVRQGEGDIAAVREAIRRLQEGVALGIFPEGSRTPNGDLAPIEPGIGLIARKAGVPVVPCIIEGSYAAWPRSQKVFSPGRIRVRFGTPMHFAHQKAAAIVQAVEQTLRRMQADIRAEMTDEAARQAWGTPRPAFGVAPRTERLP